MTTRKTLILFELNKLLEEIRQVTNEPIFESAEEIDIVEMLFYFNFTFGECKNDNFEIQLKNLIECKGLNISDDEFKLIYPSIRDFLIFFKKIT